MLPIHCGYLPAEFSFHLQLFLPTPYTHAGVLNVERRIRRYQTSHNRVITARTGKFHFRMSDFFPLTSAIGGSKDTPICDTPDMGIMSSWVEQERALCFTLCRLAAAVTWTEWLSGVELHNLPKPALITKLVC